ncbi:MAG: hypothetical protein STHCBS139747_004924 [Sporothrix thermara]
MALQKRSNHYRRPDLSSATHKTKTLQTNCALTTSLSLGARIRETYSVGAAILGGDFARGDSAARRALACQRDLLHDQVVLLEKADVGRPLDINVILQASETVRMSSIQALVDQYRRMASGMDENDVPHELPMPKWRSPSRQDVARRDSREERRGSREELDANVYKFKNHDQNQNQNHHKHGETLLPPLAQNLEPTAADPLRSKSPGPARVVMPAPVPVAPPPPVAPSARWLTYLEDDNRTTAWSVLSQPLVFQSEPPSPPLTPKELNLLPVQPPVPPLPEAYKPSAAKIRSSNTMADNTRGIRGAEQQHAGPGQPTGAADLESAYNCGFGFDGQGPTGSAITSAKTGQSGNSNTMVRPKNSVFHIFCPEAMALQVDVRRPVPATARKCRCGFRWDSTKGDGRNGSHQLKEGFGMSRRFLAKSHCEGADGGYGCVLCTSSGVAQTYQTADDLRTHINAAHDKWQMLHDRDLA